MANRVKFVPPNLANATVSGLIDQIGKLTDQRKNIDDEEKFLKSALKTRLKGKKEGRGEHYVLKVTKETQSRISPDLVREHVDEETLAKVTVESDVEKMFFTELPPKEG